MCAWYFDTAALMQSCWGTNLLFFFKWGVYFEVVFLLDAVCYEDIFYVVYI